MFLRLASPVRWVPHEPANPVMTALRKMGGDADTDLPLLDF